MIKCKNCGKPIKEEKRLYGISKSQYCSTSCHVAYSKKRHNGWWGGIYLGKTDERRDY